MAPATPPDPVDPSPPGGVCQGIEPKAMGMAQHDLLE
jgi:hypothetical protein